MDDDVHRTHSTTAQGVDRLLFVNNVLDLAPYGRQEDWEDSPDGWPQHATYGRPLDLRRARSRAYEIRSMGSDSCDPHRGPGI